MKRISVIIPAYNDAHKLERTLFVLHELRNNEYANLEIIVAVRPSTDATAKVARQFADVVVDGGFPSTGRNAGITAATGEVYIFLDADTRPGPGTLSAIAHACDTNTIGSCTTHSPTQHFMPRLAAWWMNLLRWTHVVRGVSTLVFCHRTVIVDNGIHYNEQMLLGEHHDFIYRARTAGAQWMYVRTNPGYTLSIDRYESWGYLTSCIFWIHRGIKHLLHKDVKALEQLYWSRQYAAAQRNPQELKRWGNLGVSTAGILVGIGVVFSGYVGPQQVLLLLFAEELKEDPGAPLVHALLKLILHMGPDGVIVGGLIIAICSIYLLLANSKRLVRLRA